MFLSEVLDEYETQRPGVKASSIEQVGYSVIAFERYTKHEIEVEQISEALLIEFQKARLKKCTTSTVFRNIKDLTMLMRFAKRRLKLGVEIPEVDPVPILRAIPTAWTLEEMNRLLVACQALNGPMRHLPVSRAEWWTALMLFLYDSGSRIKAALALSVKDVNAMKSTAILRGEHAKTGHEQMVDLGPETIEAIQRVIAQRNWKEDAVFVYPYCIRRIWVEFHEIMDAAKVPAGKYIGFHRVRKTHATQQVIAHGWDQARVALGHSSESMTKRYVDIRQIPRQASLLPRLGKPR
jgi:integrase